MLGTSGLLVTDAVALPWRSASPRQFQLSLVVLFCRARGMGPNRPHRWYRCERWHQSQMPELAVACCGSHYLTRKRL